jgi:hypothetical protein
VRPRLALLLGALVVPALPLVTAVPAYAATNVICVNRPATESDCNPVRYTTIQPAIAAAAADGVDSVIRIGQGTYTDGPYVFDGSTSPLTVQGSNNGTGVNATILQGGAASPYVTTTAATVRNLRITLSGSGGVGLAVGGPTSIASNVIVSDTPAATAGGATGIRAQDGAKVQGSTVRLERAAGNTGIQSSGTTVVSRVTTRTSEVGVVVVGGTLDIDNSVVDLGTTAPTGLRAGTPVATGPIDVDAKHLTVVGGAAGSRGVWSFSDKAAVSTSVTLDNSIVRGPTQSLAATVSGGGAADLDVNASDYQTEQESGGGTVDPAPTGNLVNVDPAFIAPADEDYALRSGSPVVDKADLLLTIGTDRDDLGRAFDGDGNGSPVPDMGAYELRDITAPDTTITGAPPGQTNDNTPLFQFRASEDPVTFQCQLDGGAPQPCSSPVTTTPLPDGPHTFAVRATDRVFNVEAAAASRSFTVDTRAPQTTLTKTPQKRFYKPKVKFRFVSDEAAARFQCQLDNRPWRSCSSPFTYNVKVGKHRLLVRAVDAAGNVDPTPTRHTFKRLKRHRHRCAPPRSAGRSR